MAKNYNYYHFITGNGSIWSPGTSLADARSKLPLQFFGAKFDQVDISANAPCPRCGGTVCHKSNCEFLTQVEKCVK